MSAREAALVGMDLCSAVAAVHAAGLVHGDIKTRNVMREGIPGSTQNSGRVVLMDFGSAHESIPGVEAAAASPGTPLFSAPEVLQGQAPSVRSDLYSLGVVLFRLVTSRYPVEATTLTDLVEKLRRGEHVELRSLRPDLPLAYVNVVEGALATEPTQRFPAAGAMERALVSVFGNGGGDDRGRAVRWQAHWRQARRGVAVAAAVGAVACAIVFGWRWARPLLHRPAPMLSVAYTPRLTMRGQVQSGNIGSFVSAGRGDGLGSVATAIEDPWGDGIPGILVGAGGEDRSRGRAYLLRGGPRADAVPDLVFEGEQLADVFASCIAVLGDVNADGHVDFGIGAPFNDAGGQNAGRVYVYFGGPQLDDRPDVLLTGRGPDDEFGISLAGLGDVNGDGHADIAVGSPSSRANAGGRCSVYFGGALMDTNPDLELTSEAEVPYFGAGIVGPGDLNADGFADFAILASQGLGTAGRIYVYFGGPGIDAQPDLTLRGQVIGDVFGTLAAAGDPNGDGHPDLIVSVHGDGHRESLGSAYLYFGGADLDARADVVFLGKYPDASFGCPVTGVGDVNHDGVDDVMVGANDQSGTQMEVYFGGRTLDVQSDLVLASEPFGGDVGAGGSAGDFFLDGFSDLFAGNPMIEGGRLVVCDVARYIVVRPSLGEKVPGNTIALGWLGEEPADVSISVDARATWVRSKRAVGGEAQNRLVLEVPSSRADSVVVRIEPSDPAVTGSASVAFARR